MTKIDALKLWQMDIFAKHTQHRPQIHGVWIEAAPQGGAFMVATDGVVMGVMYDPSARCDRSLLIQLERTMLTECKKGGELHCDGPGQVTLTRRGEAVTIAPHGAKDVAYPDWRRVVLDWTAAPEGPSPEWGFGMEYLARFARISQRVRLFGKGGDAATVLTEREDFFGMIMPARSHGPKGIPFNFDRGRV
ncbi:hypothetical protein [Marinobacter sp.]|uniref:hypothetical protein n=1 Tax=Marinobacter sp. TaxID=50741 RepID=UPI000C97A5D0|nr:hypothetical protein [Marinobacter sp.]MAB53459.1 hypothetical protein [Marinobacter sp.]|tara:strand:+ start:1113 stop:1685 length:573 start_codon:yes stop_codon:yes gene_type:complete